MQDEPQEYQLDGHRIIFEAPDLFCTRWDGDVTTDHVLWLYDVMDACAKGQPRLMLNDQSRLGVVDGAARNAISSDRRVRAILGTACIGSSFRMRVLVAMIMKAMKLFQREHMPAVAFFDDEAAARAWLVSLRR
jgi:hypothetical protein